MAGRSAEALAVFGERVFVDGEGFVDGAVRGFGFVGVPELAVEPVGKVAERFDDGVVGAVRDRLPGGAVALDVDFHAAGVGVATDLADGCVKLPDVAALRVLQSVDDPVELGVRLFAATQGPHDPDIDWTGIRERKDALQKVVDHLPPADEFDPYLAHYDARANSALGDTVAASLDRDIRNAYRHQVEVPAAELFKLANETVELRGNLRQTMREEGLPALYDNADLGGLREIGRKLGQAVSAGSDAYDTQLERQATNFAAVERLAADTLSAIATIDKRLDEGVAGTARELVRLRTEAGRFLDTPLPDNDIQAVRLITDFELTLSALDRQLTTLPPEARIDAALSEMEAGLSVSSLQAELRRFQVHLRLANRNLSGEDAKYRFQRGVEAIDELRKQDAALRDRDRAQTPEETTERARERTIDQRQGTQTKEQDRSVSHEEDTGMSIL